MITTSSNKHTRLFLTAASLVLALPSMAALSSISFEGTSRKVIEIEPEKSTGLNSIFVVPEIDGVEIRYKSSGSPQNVKWYKYSNLGGGYAEEIVAQAPDNSTSVLKNPIGDMGYIIEDNDKRFYFWVVNYSNHPFSLYSVKGADSQDCDSSELRVNGNGDAIHYFTINGQQKTLSREIKIIYNTLQWDESNLFFDQIEKTLVLESLTESISVMPPALCSTDFIVSGDRFLEEWGEVKSAESETIVPMAVEVHAKAIQPGAEDTTPPDVTTPPADSDSGNETDDSQEDGSNDTPAEDAPAGSNVIRTDTNGLGGSAPAEITFYSYVSDAVMHNEWQMARDPEFNDVDYRFNVQDLTYVFEEEGTFYLRFIGSNSDGSCEAASDTFEVSIGASELLCPNAFSPDGDGINDEWKVSYRSLTEFKCWIFDRAGHEIYHFEDPSAGWDGKYRGKSVRPGVYYYVIRAKGADGKNYKKSGDINILRRNVTQSPSGSATES